MNKIQKCITFCLASSLLFACATPDLEVRETLRNTSDVYEVKGTTGWIFNQQVAFGGYTSSTIKRSWPRGGSLDFILRFKRVKNKLSFTQRAPSGQRAEVLCINKFSETEHELVKGFFSLALEHDNYFAGTVAPNGAKAWDFIVFNPDGGELSNETKGHATNSKGERIEIQGLRKTDGFASAINVDTNGYEFSYRQQPIAAVSFLGHGKVWMKSDLSPELKLVTASMMSALMVRFNLEDDLLEE